MFETLFEALSGDPDFEYAIIDATIVRVHVNMAPAHKRLSWLSSGLPWGLGPKDCIEDAGEASHARDEGDFLCASSVGLVHISTGWAPSELRRPFFRAEGPFVVVSPQASLPVKDGMG